MTIRTLAFHLPQFHPVPENDLWWGKGFTEWTNVARTTAKFKDHYQPHLPADLGFYDLRLPEARQAQADLAREYGIDGFCYYHYWFNGRRILERPVNEILSSKQPDFPFCLCWANENWTRRWDGGNEAKLLEQIYSIQDDLDHLNSLLPFFHDDRYIKVNGMPVFLIYRASNIPNAKETFARWQDIAKNNGLPGLYIAVVESFASEHGTVNATGASAAVEFAPDWNCVPDRLGLTRRFPSYRKRFKDATWQDNFIVDYEQLSLKMMRKPTPDYRRHPGVTPMWDNSARRKSGAFIALGSSPLLYEAWLKNALALERKRAADGDGLVFINAWNEWAEGNHLEPCQKWGRSYLEATKRAVESVAL